MAARRIIEEKNEELRKTIAGRDKMYSVIAHDLRSPMASMKMLLNTIMMSVEKDKIDPDIFDMLEMSNKTSEEVFSLLDNLLKWTKSQLGKLTVIPWTGGWGGGSDELCRRSETYQIDPHGS